MKKVFYLIIAAVTVLFTAACSSDSSFDEPTPSPAPSPTNTPKTTVQLGVSKSGSVGLFLLEEEKRYGGYRPRRTYNGYRYQPGYSDHLPLVARLKSL